MLSGIDPNLSFTPSKVIYANCNTYYHTTCRLKITYKNCKHCKPIPCNENRVFPVKFSHREIPVMKTGVPAMRIGVPCNENRFFPVWKTSQGKPCSGPVLALYRIAVYAVILKTPKCYLKVLPCVTMVE